MTTPPPPGSPCTCSAHAGICNLSDCRQPWAVAERRRLRPSLIERIVGFFAAFLAWGRQ